MDNAHQHSDMRGMTINERLFVSGKMEFWEKAKNEKNRDLMIQILISADLNQKEAEWAVDHALKI